MRCLVVILSVVACARLSAGAAASCARAERFLTRYNVSADDSDEPGADLHYKQSADPEIPVESLIATRRDQLMV